MWLIEKGIEIVKEVVVDTKSARKRRCGKMMDAPEPSIAKGFQGSLIMKQQ